MGKIEKRTAFPFSIFHFRFGGSGMFGINVDAVRQAFRDYLRDRPLAVGAMTDGADLQGLRQPDPEKLLGLIDRLILALARAFGAK
jgi:hypothetical protein